MLKTMLAGVVAIGFVTIGCGKDKGDGGGGAAKPPAKLTWMKVGGLGLEVELPEGSTIDDNTSGAGFPMATLWASPTLFIKGPGGMSDVKPTIEETKQDLEKDPNKLKAFTREEKTADGWIIEATRERMTDKTEIHAVWVRRTIDGTTWDCGSNADKAEIAPIIKICQSLRAAAK